MAPGIPSGEGSSGDTRDRSIPVPEVLKPFPPSVIKFFCEYDLDFLRKMWSGLSHLPVDDGLDALGKKLKEYSRSKAPPVHTSEDEDDEDEMEEDEDEELDEDEKKDMEGETLKLLDDGKKPLCAEEHQVVYSEFERECKKPKIS